MDFSSKKKRRTKTAEKTAEQREDELPWELPLPLDPTFLPTSLYKNGFVTSLSPPVVLSSASNAQTEPTTAPYLFSTTFPTLDSPMNFQPYHNSTKVEARSPDGSGCVSSPAHQQRKLSTSGRAASNSCPVIATPAPHLKSSVFGGSKGDVSTMSAGKVLPPIGVFWDIENCSVPRGRSALIAVQRIRERFFVGHVEAEFLCVCDIRKEPPSVIQELNDAQVSVIHVSGNSKNAADDKLRQAMRRFADISCSNPLYSSLSHPATVVLISGDINFATDLSDLRHRKSLYITLLHNKHAPEALLLCANEQYEFHSVLADLPFRTGYRDLTDSATEIIPLKGGQNRVDVLVTELPVYNNIKVQNLIRHRLRKLSENCGGKLLCLRGPWALLRFPNYEAALRASKRMNGEDVLGNKIRAVTCPQTNSSCTSANQNFSHQSPPKDSEFFSSHPSWKPGWKRPGEPFHRNLPPRFQKLAVTQKDHETSSTSRSNSSSPVNDASRDGSPIYMKSQHIASSSKVQHLNNSERQQRYPQTIPSAIATTSSFAFHQNLYPPDEGVSRQASSRQQFAHSTVSNCKLHASSEDDDDDILDTQIIDPETLEMFCKRHPPKVKSLGKLERNERADMISQVLLLNVKIELKTLSSRVHTLLQTHPEGVPMISFLDCYESEFEVLEGVPEGQGVPLEHLIACVQGVQIVLDENAMKRMEWRAKEHNLPDNMLLGQPQSAMVSRLGRDMMDLLKTVPKSTLHLRILCQMYHARFKRHCRPTDYGYQSLSALLHTLPHIVQLMGVAQHTVLTLSHHAQMKRFATDVLRVLKSSEGGTEHQIKMDDFPSAFAVIFSPRRFEPEEYGLCRFTDLVAELVETSTLVTLLQDEYGNKMLAVPKREQTAQVIQHTERFAKEIVELLRPLPGCEMFYSKFLEAYEHHFKKRCHVLDYGFSTLPELFETITRTALILSPSFKRFDIDERIIRLAPSEQVQIVGEQIRTMTVNRTQRGDKTRVDEILDSFVEEYGFALRPKLCGADTVNELIYRKLTDFVKVDEKTGELIPLDRNQIKEVAEAVEIILQGFPQHRTSMDNLLSALKEKSEALDITSIEEGLRLVACFPDEVNGGTTTVALAPLRIFAHEITLLLDSHGGHLPLKKLEDSYLQKFGHSLRPVQFGYSSIVSLLQAIPDVITLNGRIRPGLVILLNSASAEKELVAANGSLPVKTEIAPSSPPRAGEERVSTSGLPNASTPEEETNATESQPPSPPVVWTCHPVLFMATEDPPQNDCIHSNHSEFFERAATHNIDLRLGCNRISESLERLALN